MLVYPPGLIFATSRSMNPNFKYGSAKIFIIDCTKTLCYRVYPFLNRYNLFIQTATRIGQKLSGHLYTVKISFVENVMEKFDAGGEYAGIPKSSFVNMEETVV